MPLAGRYYSNPLEMVDKASKRLREVMDGLDASLFIGVVTTTGLVTYINKAALNSMGLLLKDVVGKPLESTIWWSYSDTERQKLRLAIEQAAEGHASRFSHIMLDASGQLRTFDFSLTPVFEQNGRVAYLVPSSHDITERNAAEQALRLTQFAVDHAPDALLQVNHLGLITSVNESACQLLGQTPAQLVGQSIYHVDHHLAPNGWPHLWQQLKRQGVQRFEANYRHIHGEEISVEVSANYIAYQQEQYAFIYVNDIRHRKAAEQEKARLNRALRLLSACNYALIHAQDEKKLLQDICQLMVSVGGGYRMAWVGYTEYDEEKNITPVAYAGEERGYLTYAKVTWDANDLRGQGPCGQAIRSGQVVVCEDVSISQAMYWRKQAYEYGFRGIICLPLRDKDQIFGLLGLYTAHTLLKLSVDEIALLQELADNLAFGIKNIRAQQERQQMLSAILTISESIALTTGYKFMERLALSMTQTLGAIAGFITRLHQESDEVDTISAVIQGQVVDNMRYQLQGTPCEYLLTQESFVVTKDAIKIFPYAENLAVIGAQSYVGRQVNNAEGTNLGQLFVLFKEPIHNPDFVLSVLTMFATRAAVEMERV
ncbi:PAS domain S-box protein [Agitococcus lubricus]|uniref:PAS domain S-box-containing protein n=1 Tax=Agitococcus lubricus TaxID=1077255 RepID=A0A2T5IZR6_9GAMM|nr:PAS domain S-box protein [Agitococcus lubricus]PTQ89556.1 PAS domain S-box-containing protein [Agitococcus lubricus]